MNKKIAILGGGNLGQSIARGLLESGYTEASQITVTRRHLQHLKTLENLGIQVTSSNKEAVKNAQFILLCVQPKQLPSLLEEILPELKENHHILISNITGASLGSIQHKVGNEIALFRAMPNTAISIRESMTCICLASNEASKKSSDDVLKLFKSVGEALIIEEEQMASATVLAACGIAFALRFIRACAQGGVEVGFESDLAHKIAAQTVKGAATLLQKTDHHPESEIDKVTTPQGCTIAGLNEMEHRGFSSALIKGISTSFHKITKIASEIKS